MIKVGLTGGIGSGKTTASDMFAELGSPVIDTDIIARQVIQSPSIIQQLVELFGEGILAPNIAGQNHSIDRSVLASIVFSHADKKQQLEHILHPEIRQSTLQQIDQLDQQIPYVIIVVPLLFETDFHTLVDRRLVVISDTETRISRVYERDNRNRQQIEGIIKNQMSDVERLERADDIIENNSNIENIREQVLSLHQGYTNLNKQ